MKRQLTGWGVAGCFVALAALFLLAPFILMLAWNVVVSGVLHGPELNYLQAFALWVLIGFIRGGFTVAREASR